MDPHRSEPLRRRHHQLDAGAVGERQREHGRPRGRSGLSRGLGPARGERKERRSQDGGDDPERDQCDHRRRDPAPPPATIDPEVHATEGPGRRTDFPYSVPHEVADVRHRFPHVDVRWHRSVPSSRRLKVDLGLQDHRRSGSAESPRSPATSLGLLPEERYTWTASVRNSWGKPCPSACGLPSWGRACPDLGCPRNRVKPISTEAPADVRRERKRCTTCTTGQR